ncbi:MAG: sugar phosphate permease [Woeseiaceae bacterium]|jgi:sugar phosphate permease
MRRVVQITILIVAGELIFGLPFHISRYFRPTMLDVFAFSNTDLGDIFAVYGITAMLSYFPGGVIADQYSARTLLSISLLMTALGGLYMATIPGAAQMALLFGYWGVTSILLFWAAMIRATREWGGDMSQGKAFGILDGGRGFVGAAVAVLAVSLLASYLPQEVATANDEERRAGLSAVILFYSLITAAVGVLTWFFLPESQGMPPRSAGRSSFNGAMEVLKKPLVWAQAGIIICAYCGYKGGDNISLYAVQVLGMNEVDGAKLSAYATYIRPVAAVVAGILADRFIASRVLGITFAVLVVSYFLLFLAVPSGIWLSVIYANIVISFFAVYALRGIYFALVHETRTPKNLTGTTVGVVSFVGFTPEIFFAPITGRILDASPGVPGHQNYFLFLAACSAIGLAMVFYLLTANKRNLATISA